ncbi:MAG: thiamine phosphate synthase, partial [Actinobacteria bacterium]|nr:thiamine phosphate synthase [Actinomycetota bacterium]
GVGPIFATSSKEDVGKPIGYHVIAAIKKKVKIPVLGIGGINILNLDEVIKAGADGVAVISAVSESENPKKAVQDLVEKIRDLK